MMTDQRIKLAEFVDVCPTYTYNKPLSCEALDGAACELCGCGSHSDFDPRNSADDCEALIRKLREQDWMMTHTRYRGRTDHIVIQHPEHGKHGWAGDDYKHGVCDLAEKIIEQQENGDGNNDGL